MQVKLGKVTIGNAVIPHGLFLAPMAGFTDITFRDICRERGAEYTVTEMISAKAVCFGDKKTGELAAISDSRTALQIFGHEPEAVGEAVRRLLSGIYPLSESGSLSPAAIDINMGCPVKKIVSSGDGSALMQTPSLCRDIVAAARENAGDIPITVKLRAGFSAEHKNAAEVALAAVSGGAAAVFVHGRTREQMYAPSSDNSVIAAVRDALPANIPVIGNGDITSAEDAERMLRETGCDGIMIGRAALGDPWLFERIVAASEGEILPEPSIRTRLDTALRLCAAVCERYGESRGVSMCRGRAGHFIRGISGAAAMREKLCRASSFSDIENCLTQ